MANSIVSYTGADPNGNQSVMSKVTVTSAGFLSLADIKSSDTYTLRLWIKASGARTALAYIGGSAYTISATTSWQVCKFTAQATPSSCDLYLPAGTYYIWHPKLERSSKASDYSPAPEDVDENIEDSANAATNAANAYTDGALQSYSTTAEMRSEINQTRDEINLSVTEQITQTRTYADRKAAEARTNAGTDTDTKLQSYVTTTTHTADLQVLSNQISSKVSTTTFNTLAGRVTNAENGITQNTADITAANSALTTLTGRVTTAESAIVQNATDISSTVTAVSALDGRLTTAESVITQTSNSLSSTITTVNGLGTRMTTAESNISQNSSDISQNTSDIAQHTSDISATNNAVSSLSTRVTTAESNITQNATDISATVRSVSSLDGRVTTAESNITQNTTEISLRVIKGDRTVSGSTVNDTISEINTSTKGILLSTAGKLQITAGNFKLDSLGNATLKGGIIQSSNYIANTSGTKIDLSDGTIDSKNFKVSSAGVMTATGAVIKGSTFQIDTTGQGGENVGYITLKNVYNYTVSGQSASETFTLSEKPNGIYLSNVVLYGSSVQTSASTDIVPGQITVSDLAGYTSISGAYGINTNYLYCDELHINGTIGIAMRTATFSTYGDTLNVGISEMPLRLCGSTIHTTTDLNFFTSGHGIMFGGIWAYRMYDGEMALGADSKNMRFYARNIYFNAPAYTNTGVIVTSDLRKKTDVGLLDSRYLDLIKHLTPARFKIKSIKNDHFHTGFIAQEVLGALAQAGLTPEEVGMFVDIHKDGSDYALRYDEIAALLLLYIKDLEAQIKELK